MIAIYWMGCSNRFIAREEVLWLAFIGRDIAEAPATTFFIPPGRRARMDEWSLLWLS